VKKNKTLLIEVEEYFIWKNGKGYYATVFELIPSLEHILTNNGNIHLETFSGYIST
jgi:hypothetical protein